MKKHWSWNGQASRRNTLTVTCAHTGELRSAALATQAQLTAYAETRQLQRLTAAIERGLPVFADAAVGNARTRRALRRMADDKHGAWVRSVTPMSR